MLVAGSSTGISDEAEVEHIINVLKVTPRCTSAGQSKYNGPDLNRMDVHVKVEIDGVWTSIRRSGSAVFDTKLKMAREVRRRVEEIVGKAVVDLAEEQMMSAEESQLGRRCLTQSSAGGLIAIWTGIRAKTARALRDREHSFILMSRGGLYVTCTCKICLFFK